jgi:hypothetical protein
MFSFGTGLWSKPRKEEEEEDIVILLFTAMQRNWQNLAAQLLRNTALTCL